MRASLPANLANILFCMVSPLGCLKLNNASLAAGRMVLDNDIARGVAGTGTQ